MKPEDMPIQDFKRELDEADQSIQRTAEECEQEEIKRLGRIPVEQLHRDTPTLEVERNWNRIRWGDET